MQRPKNEPPAKLIGWEDVPSLRMDLDWKELVRVAYELAKESGYLPSRGAQNDKLLFARSLFRDALTAVQELTPAVKSTPENFAWIFAKEREWPILWTDFLDHRQSNAALLETLRGQPAITPKASKQLESAAKLFARAHSAVTKLNAAAQADPDTYSKIAAKAPIGWPVLWAWSDDPTDPETSPRLIQDLAELERGPFKVFKGGRKALRLDMTKPMNKAAGRGYYLISKACRGGSPSTPRPMRFTKTDAIKFSIGGSTKLRVPSMFCWRNCVNVARNT